ncbi:hypothetical protein R6Z02_04815 [Carnobacterium maltaromaticum]|uniref:sunset domain-containing protein n=1 Tax=Carnobacterium maltaromaticum TaxID=2751 RepID=UPI00298AD49B|nr:hypothetical protein [Carnobacterium maltaromaticum]MDW5523070.1 hypothetical protein [Carnobacterium maltaromaticum]
MKNVKVVLVFLFLLNGSLFPAFVNADEAKNDFITVEKSTVIANKNGEAKVSGTTKKKTKVNYGKFKSEKSDSKGKFTLTLKNKTKEKKAFTLKVKIHGETYSKKVSVKPYSKKEAEQKKLEAEAKKIKKEKLAKELKTATNAVKLAERKPTRASYDKANTLVVALTNENKELSNRLIKIMDTVEANEALAQKKAESESKEKERIANEKLEAERKIAEEQKALEEKRIADEQARIAQEQEQQQAQTAAEVETGQGLIKGSESGIYHTPGSTYYDRTTNVVQWFNTIEEAVAAGYRAPKR